MKSPLSKFAAAVISRLPLKLVPPVKVVEPGESPMAIPPLPGMTPAGATQPGVGQAKQPRPPSPLRLRMLKPGIKPTPLQQQFMDFMVRNDGVGIAAHTVGSGKTAASIMAYLRLKELNKAHKALVIVPAGLRENYAIQGVKKFSKAKAGIIGNQQEIFKNPRMDVGRMGQKDFYVMSYDMFKKNPLKYLKMTGADTIIADEMHRMKDPQTQLHRVIHMIRPHVRNFIGMTATPSMNDPFEAVSLINAISKKKMSPAEFQKDFYERKADGIMDWMFGLFTHEHHGPVEGFKNTQQLGKYIGAAYHFAEPEMTDFPKKKVDVVKVPMTDEQTNLYKSILDKSLTAVEKRILERGELVPNIVLQRIVNKTMAVRQLSNNRAYPEGNIDVTTPKVLSMVVDAVREIKRNPRGQVIMFSNFIDNGTNVLENALGEAHVPYSRITGMDPKDVRDKSVTDYNAGKTRVMIISGAGSEGLNLPNTTMVQMMDGHYNPERITQTEGRGIRKGGLSYLPPEKRIVKVKRYVAVPDDNSMSVDERIYNIAAKKAAFIKQFKDIVTKWQEHQQKLLARRTSVPGTVRTQEGIRA